MRPDTRADGYAIQRLIEGVSIHPLRGWKIAATSAADQRHINVDGPLAGRPLAERIVPEGEPVSLGANRMRVAELEFVFRMGHALPPRPNPYMTNEVMAAVAALHLGIEVPDSRYLDFTAVGAPQLIADNACADQFVLGPEVTAPWRAYDLAAHYGAGDNRAGRLASGVRRQCSRRPPNGIDVARQRTSPVRHCARRRSDRYDGHLRGPDSDRPRRHRHGRLWALRVLQVSFTA